MLSRCKNFGDGMGGSGKEVIGRGLWASGLTSGSFCSGRAGGLWRGGEVGVGVGDWSLNAPGAPVGMCVVSILRLGPLSVGLAAKSQSGKANFETCAGQLWELSKEPSTAGMATWCVSVCRPDFSGKSLPHGSLPVPHVLQVPAPTHLNRQSRTGSCSCPCPHLVDLPCLTVASRHGQVQRYMV